MGNKFGWDLPPGVSTSDIPGNDAASQAHEALWEELYTKHAWLASMSDGKRVHCSVTELHDKIVKLADEMFQRGIAEGESRAGEVLAEKEQDAIEAAYEEIRHEQPMKRMRPTSTADALPDDDGADAPDKEE